MKHSPSIVVFLCAARRQVNSPKSVRLLERCALLASCMRNDGELLLRNLGGMLAGSSQARGPKAKRPNSCIILDSA